MLTGESESSLVLTLIPNLLISKPEVFMANDKGLLDYPNVRFNMAVARFASTTARSTEDGVGLFTANA